MSITLIPETAPFNPEQRAWLNGFLAGWLGLQGTDGASAAGFTQALPAQITGSVLAAPPVAVEEFPWHDPALPIADRMKLAEEKPIERKLMAAMAQLDCGACGYLCKTYSEAIATGTEPSLTLCSPGGSETSKMLKRLLKEEAGGKTAPNGAVAGEVNGKAATNGLAKAPARWSRKNPYPAQVIRSVNLNRPGSEKEVRHVEIDLGDALTYKVGDALGVYPENCDALVDELLGVMGASGDEMVALPAGTETSLREALARRRCLTEVNESTLELLAGAAADPAEARQILELIDDDAPITGFDVYDVLRRFPSARPTPSELVVAMSELKPRLYSISSSPKRHPGQVHLTVGKVTYQFNDRLRKGVASTMFADRVAPGGEVRVFVHESHGFTVPADPAAPMIMVGPGTGIAPFRAFLQERAAVGAPGKNWLFFGDQRGATDFLYEEELKAMAAEGVLTRLDTAFSRDQDRKIYVQHRMAEHGAALYDWLESGAYVFVCGDAKRMAADVDRALHEVIRTHGGKSDDAAKSYVAALTAAGRYCRDVY